MSRTAQEPSSETALMLQGTLPRLALVTPPEANARSPPATRTMIRDGPGSVSVKGGAPAVVEVDALGRGVPAHINCAAARTTSGDSSALASKQLPMRAPPPSLQDPGCSEASPISASVALTLMPRRADRMIPALLIGMASSQRGQKVGSTESGTEAIPRVPLKLGADMRQRSVAVDSAARKKAPAQGTWDNNTGTGTALDESHGLASVTGEEATPDPPAEPIATNTSVAAPPSGACDIPLQVISDVASSEASAFAGQRLSHMRSEAGGRESETLMGAEATGEAGGVAPGARRSVK